MSYEKQQAAAMWHARSWFTEQSFVTIRHGFEQSTLELSVENVIDRNPDASRMKNIPPTSVDDFLSSTKGIFSKKLVDILCDKFKAFDDLCGEPLSGVFLAAHPCGTWIMLITENTLRSTMRAVEEKYRSDSDSSYMDLKPPVYLPQFDGTSDQPSPPTPITQIDLEGATLAEAWRSNDDIQKVTSFDKVPSPAWTPSSHGGAPVWHGTQFHSDGDTSQSNVDSALLNKPSKLVRTRGKTQIYPEDHDKKGFYTSFSALRAFAYAVFRGDVFQDPPNPTSAEGLQRHFRLGTDSFRGILLLKFESSQPVPPSLSWYQIPVGQESEWQRIVSQWTEKAGEDVFRIWATRLKPIHGMDTADYPDVVHGKDLPSLQQAFRRLPCNNALLWQTAWMSEKAMATLNSRIEHIYAISFTVVNQQASEAKQGKFTTLTRNMGKLKKAMSKKDMRSD